MREPVGRRYVLWLGLGGIALMTAYAVAFLMAESELAVGILLAVAAAAVFGAARLKLLDGMGAAFKAHDRVMHGAIVCGVLVLAAVFHGDHFTLLMIVTVLLYVLAGLGLNIQLGHAGILNLAGGAFFGVGCYTAAVLTTHEAFPPLLVLPAGGLMAALIGSILVLPVLRTRGHYSAVITIAFAILFKTLLEVSDSLGGPQGLPVGAMRLSGWDFNQGIAIGGIEMSFYMSYLLLALVLLVAAFGLTKRLERSWIGLSMDAVRLDETASACFGLNIARWKITAFSLGNFLIGLSGALYGMVLGFIAPANFAFEASLIFISIVLLGGTGNPWGLALASAIVIILPEKLQLLAEYRYLLFAWLVAVILLFRPEGLLPRGLRVYEWPSK